MKTLEEIKKEVASECFEEHFDVLLQSEIDVGDYVIARALLIDVANRYVDQFSKIEITPGVFGKFNDDYNSIDYYGYLDQKIEDVYFMIGSSYPYPKFTPGLPPLHREEK